MSKHAKNQIQEPLDEKLQEFLAQVREMPRGGDLEGLIEDNAAELRLLLYEAAARQRQQSTADAPADFPPSGLPELPAGDEADR
jgi:hypothetical protein